MRLATLNPFTSLFGKIFLWFCLTVMIMLASAFFLGRLINEHVQITLADEQVLKGQRLAIDNLQGLLRRDVPLNRAMRRAGNRRFPLSILVDLEQQNIELSFPPPVVTERFKNYRERLFDLASSEDVLTIKTPNMEMLGPFIVSVDNKQYQLFLARVLRRDEQVEPALAPLLILILSVGVLLCLLLAWRLTKPLKRLRVATNQISQGDLSVRVEGYEKRLDEIGQLARDFNAMADKLASSIEQQQLLMANISHELRTPLTRLQLASAILEDVKDDELKAKNLRRIEKEIGVMDTLIGQAIDLARMSLTQLSNKDKPPFEICNIKVLMEDLMAALELEREAAGVQIDTQGLSDQSILIHAPSLQSAFENLARNAIRFAKSKVSLDFEFADKTMIMIISDDGKGLSESEFMNYLKPFNYAQAQDNEHHSYGLGLAIAEAGIRMHNGRLRWHPSKLGGLSLKVTIASQ